MIYVADLKITRAFTLIELLIVVAIISILAAIAVPNFLEAQTRSKVARTMGDMRTVGLAIETYCVDYNHYPPGYKTTPVYGLDVLTTPIAYITSSMIFDVFKPIGDRPSKALLTYELVNSDGKMLEGGGDGIYTVDPADPATGNPRGVWWWLASRGPNNTFGFRPSDPEYNICERFYQATWQPSGLLDIIYDPTNGTISVGDIFRAGGAVSEAGIIIYSTY